MNIASNANPIEIVWVCITLIGIMVALPSYLDARRDVEAALLDPENDLTVYMLAVMRRRNFLARLSRYMMWCGIGIFAVKLPGGSTLIGGIATVGVLIAIGLVGGLIIDVTSSTLDLRDRQNLMSILRKRKSHPTTTT